MAPRGQDLRAGKYYLKNILQSHIAIFLPYPKVLISEIRDTLNRKVEGEADDFGIPLLHALH